jgi:hypothetical protein
VPFLHAAEVFSVNKMTQGLASATARGRMLQTIPDSNSPL